jgi:hypothetical protein
VRRVWRQRNEGSGQGPCAQLIAPCRPCTRAPGNTSKYSRLKGHRAAGPARPSPDGDGQPRDRIAVAVAVAVAGARRPLLCTGSGQRAACRSTRDPARRRPSLFCSVPSHRLLSAHRQTQIMCCSHSSAQEASAPPASAPHRQRPHGLRCGRRTGAERSPNRQTGMGPQLQLSSSAGPGAVLEPCWSWVSLDAEARGQLQRDGDATGRRTTTGVAERASRRQARSGCPPALRARELAAAHGASARAVSFQSRLCLCHGSFGARPRPCAAAFQACWRQSRRTSRCLWAPHPGYLENKSTFSCPSLVVPPAWVKRAAWHPAVVARALKDTPARYLHRQRHGGMSDNRVPFTPGPAQATILHSAGPSRPARQQTPTDGQWAGSGCATCFHPRRRIVVCGPMLVWLSKSNLNGVAYDSFVPLLLPCLVCDVYLRSSVSASSAPARSSPEACSRARPTSSPLPIQIPQTLGQSLSPG